jgi:hypothetical protein
MEEQAAKVSEYEGTGDKGERRREGKEEKVSRWISMNWEVQLLPACMQSRWRSLLSPLTWWGDPAASGG